MTEPLQTRTVRELGGEIWAELTYAFRDDIHWQTLDSAVDVIMGVLARHDGVTVMNDEDLPVTPLPERNFET